MEKSIHMFLEDSGEKLTNPKTLKAEFSLFEVTNKRTKNLLFDALKTTKPSSVASERVFSVSGLRARNLTNMFLLLSRDSLRTGFVEINPFGGVIDENSCF
ncbi:hypothetical protein TNCV_614271 [Trichonephila clavipes]|nr:hypothetical protein TNCV_614271 [Trichonephila clavipes]